MKNTQRKGPLFIKPIILFLAALLWSYPAEAFAQDPATEACLECHADRSLAAELPGGGERSLFVDSEALLRSVHGKLACTQCHADANPEELPHPESLQRVRCGTCHLEKNGMQAPHFSKEVFKNYAESVHGKAARGNPRAPHCNDCHGTHDILSPSSAASKVSRTNVPFTCGRCHERIFREWQGSVHGEGFATGLKTAPVCTDCHGEHTIHSPRDPHSTVHPSHVADTCSQCHANELLQRQLGLPTLRLETYRSSYHGIMNRLGVTEVAHCASCHGAHLILPSADKRSHVNKANLPQTCGTCHPGIGKGVSLGRVHIIGSRAADPLYWGIKAAYQVFIVFLVGFFVLYVVLDLYAYRRGRPSHAVSKERPDDPLSHTFAVRFTPNEKWQHITLAVSFTLLMVSGMPVSFSESGWADRVLRVPDILIYRAIAHRIGAVLLMLLAVWHCGYLFTRRGREQLKHMLWRIQDFRDIAQMLRCYLGWSKEKPAFGRFNWIEKSEYLAVFWGTAIMVATGLALWFESQALHILPLWAWHIARLVHSYESLLAILSIIVWHMYHVHFKPGIFPMSHVWLTGKISLRHRKEEHPLDQSPPENPEEKKKS